MQEARHGPIISKCMHVMLQALCLTSSLWEGSNCGCGECWRLVLAIAALLKALGAAEQLLVQSCLGVACMCSSTMHTIVGEDKTSPFFGSFS